MRHLLKALLLKKAFASPCHTQEKIRHLLKALLLNKAVYTAALVADGWAGAENLEKQFCDQATNGSTEKLVIESRVRG